MGEGICPLAHRFYFESNSNKPIIGLLSCIVPRFHSGESQISHSTFSATLYRPLMKVALISRVVARLHGYGGLERHVYELARYLAAHVDVTLYTMPPIYRGASWNLPDVKLEIFTTPRLPLRGIADRITNYPYWSAKVGERIAQEKFDLVLAQGLAGWGYAREKRNGRARAPLLINPQGMEEFKRRGLKQLAYYPVRYLLRQAASVADGIIAADSQAFYDIPRFLRVPREQVHYVPNGIDVAARLQPINDELARRLALKYQLANRTPILMSVGRLEENKGFEFLIRALGEIRPMLPSKWVWMLIGDGPERAKLERQIRAARIREHTRMIGAVDDVTLNNFYQLAHLFVHPTLFEGSSLVTLEAMAHRLPVVATTVGGIPDKVRKGRNGFLVSPGNAHELGEKIVTASSDMSKLKQMGQESYDIALNEFDWAHVIKQNLALFQQFAPSSHIRTRS